MSDTKDQVIVVEHFQNFPGDTTPSSHILGLYKYYNDKSLRHVFQHYKDVATQPGRAVVLTNYYEGEKYFTITYSDENQLSASVRPLNCVTALPLAPFLPRSEVEAQKMARESEVALSKK
jgi:hypothetical protein